MTENQSSSPVLDEEINLLDLLIVLVRNKRMIIGVTFIAAVLAAIVMVRKPNIYTGTVKILPPKSSQSGAAGMLSQLSSLGSLGGAMGGAFGLKDPNAIYVAMLKSRNIMEKVIQKFDLQKVYKTETLTDTLLVLGGVSDVGVGKDGLIGVSVDDEDPKRAADIANAYIAELNELVQTFALTDASQRRQYFETQMKPAKDKITETELLLGSPRNNLEYIDALRSVKYQEAVYEVLIRQFEMAKLDEANDAPLIQVLDKAVMPEKKSKPRRTRAVLQAAFVAGFLVTVFVFLKEARLKALANPEQSERMRTLSSHLWKL